MIQSRILFNICNVWFKELNIMKPLKNTFAKSRQQSQKESADKSRSNRIHITLVSDKERELYRVPSYGYILP